MNNGRHQVTWLQKFGRSIAVQHHFLQANRHYHNKVNSKLTNGGDVNAVARRDRRAAGHRRSHVARRGRRGVAGHRRVATRSLAAAAALLLATSGVAGSRLIMPTTDHQLTKNSKTTITSCTPKKTRLEWLSLIRNYLKQISATFVTTLDISNICAMTNPEQIHSSGMQVKWKQP